MKKLVQTVFMAGCLLISADLMSKDKDFSLSFEKGESETVNFQLSNAKNVSVVVYNDFYGELFAENFDKNESVSKSYNFKNLDAGTYFLVLESPQKIEKYSITVSADKKVMINSKPVSTVTKPEFLVEGNKVKVLLSGVQDSAKISISDFDNNIYYNATKSTENGELALSFDLSKKTADSYIISVEENGRVFNKIIRMR